MTLTGNRARDVSPDDPIGPGRRRRGMLFVCLAVAGVGFALSIQMGLNVNFLVQVIHVDPSQQGNLEAVRESCGIFAFGVLALLAGFAEPLVGAAMLVLVGLGLGAYGFVSSYGWVVAMSLVWSQGLHVWMPLPNSIALSLAEPGRTGRRLGQMQSAGAVGAGLGLLAALAILACQVDFSHGWRDILNIESMNPQAMRGVFIVAGVMAVVAATACLGIPRDLKTPGPRLVFRRRYGLYYTLCFLEGWRKQIFICWAPFLLIKEYGTCPVVMLLLAGVIQVIGLLAAPRVGQLIDRVGERRTLAAYYSGIILVFLGYAFIPGSGTREGELAALYCLFVLDSALFLCNMATTTYVNRIAPKSEHTATLSVGVAANHVAAVCMPFVGGLLWLKMGPRWTFLAGATAAVLSVLAALRVPGRARLETDPIMEHER